jgi:hypothetical protein
MLVWQWQETLLPRNTLRNEPLRERLSRAFMDDHEATAAGQEQLRRRPLTRSNVMPEQPYGLVSRDALVHLRQRRSERLRERDESRHEEHNQRRRNAWYENHRSALTRPPPETEHDADTGAGAQDSNASAAEDDEDLELLSRRYARWN